MVSLHDLIILVIVVLRMHLEMGIGGCRSLTSDFPHFQGSHHQRSKRSSQVSQFNTNFALSVMIESKSLAKLGIVCMQTVVAQHTAKGTHHTGKGQTGSFYAQKGLFGQSQLNVTLGHIHHCLNIGKMAFGNQFQQQVKEARGSRWVHLPLDGLENFSLGSFNIAGRESTTTQSFHLSWRQALRFMELGRCIQTRHARNLVALGVSQEFKAFGSNEPIDHRERNLQGDLIKLEGRSNREVPCQHLTSPL
mmetsp:Transcript_30407/g.42567  ORF Transcript_30407/g.42567 Transcript_30407/m.42567 type:complete len:249 (+) Transcript_30407:1-747(+)